MLTQLAFPLVCLFASLCYGGFHSYLIYENYVRLLFGAINSFGFFVCMRFFHIPNPQFDSLS